MKNYVLTGLLMLGLTLVGCSKDEIEGGGSQPEAGEGFITVKLLDEAAGTKAEPNNEGNTINDYMIYVFNHVNGILETSVPGDPSLTTEVPNVSTATRKRVVVLTNRGTGNYPSVTNYEQFKTEDYYLNLDDQMPTGITTKGYTMSGHSGDNTPVTVTTAGTSVTVSLNRVVAKLVLESITFVPDDGHDLGKLTITGVAAQRVAPDITLSPIAGIYSTAAGSGYHYGGFASADAQLQLKSYLKEDLSITKPYAANQKYEFDADNTFIVFPNSDEENCTLLTIAAKYGDPGDEETIYYPIKINYQNNAGNGDTTNGTLVQSNMIYTLNVTLKKFGNGTTDPEIPSEEGTLEVTVEVKPWETINQNEEW